MGVFSLDKFGISAQNRRSQVLAVLTYWFYYGTSTSIRHPAIRLATACRTRGAHPDGGRLGCFLSCPAGRAVQQASVYLLSRSLPEADNRPQVARSAVGSKHALSGLCL